MDIPLHTATRRVAAVRAFVRQCATAAGERLHELAGIWRHAAARRQMGQMDDRTLRDLGVHRSELESYFAESHRWAPTTRRRIADLIDGRVGR